MRGSYFTRGFNRRASTGKIFKCFGWMVPGLQEVGPHLEHRGPFVEGI